MKKKLLKEQISRCKRYLIIFFRHMTLKKLLNLFRLEIRFAKSDPVLKNIYPYTLFVDISNACNLKCPLCEMGKKQLIRRKNIISYERYVELVSPLKEYLYLISLFNWGEPFLNNDIYRIIQFNSLNNIGTSVSSNLNLPIDADELVGVGLEHLIISGDGITQEVYEKYRAGGKIEFVFENLRKITTAKNKANSKYPYIEWQCLVTKWNEFQLEEIKKTALSLGANEVRFGNINFYSEKDIHRAEEEWLPEDPDFRAFSLANIKSYGRNKRIPCFWLWRTAIINPNGGITPCCIYDTPDWGNLCESDFSEIWNNEKYTFARLLSKPSLSGAKQIDIRCNSCTVPFVRGRR